jgi:hypothetical protein
MCAERRTAPGKTVDVGKSLSAHKRTEAKTKVSKGQRIAAIRSNNLLDNAAIAELLIREAEGASGYPEQAFRRATRTAVP